MSTPAPTVTWKPDLGARSWLGIAYVGLLAYLDWLTKRDPFMVLLLGGGAILVILYRRPLATALQLQTALASVPRAVRALLVAAPAMLYFLLRGQGTSGAGWLMLLAMVAIVLIGAIYGAAIDTAMAGLYRARNRLLPRWLRMALAVVIPVLLAFLIVHGTLTDLPAMFGLGTNSPATPRDRPLQFLAAAFLSAAAVWLLVREPPASPAVAGDSGVPTGGSPGAPRVGGAG